MLWKKGDNATRSRAKLLTWMPGVMPEMMPRRKPRKMESIRKVREMSIEFTQKSAIIKSIML